MVNTLYPNIETPVQDILTHQVQQDSQKEVKQEHLDQVSILERSKVWQKMENISSPDLKIVNVELLVNHKEILGELKKEVEIQVQDIIEFLLILVIMSPVKLKEDSLKLPTVEKEGLEEAL